MIRLDKLIGTKRRREGKEGREERLKAEAEDKMAGEGRPEATPLVQALMHGSYSSRPEPGLLSNMIHHWTYSLVLLICLNPPKNIQPIF